MVKLVSTKTHAVLDYVSVAALATLPRALGWSPPVTNLLTGAAASTLVYSLLTRYELGAVKLLPMPAHLALDAASGAMLASAPLALTNERKAVVGALIGIGLFEIAAALSTATEPGAPAAV